MQFGLLVLVFPAFVAISFYGYSQNDMGGEVAKVGDVAITQVQWDQELQRQGQLMRQSNPDFDASALETPAQKEAGAFHACCDGSQKRRGRDAD